MREHSCTINVELLNKTELLNNVSFTYYVSLKNDRNLSLSSVGRPQCFFFLSFFFCFQVKLSVLWKTSWASLDLKIDKSIFPPNVLCVNTINGTEIIIFFKLVGLNDSMNEWLITKVFHKRNLTPSLCTLYQLLL